MPSQATTGIPKGQTQLAVLIGGGAVCHQELLRAVALGVPIYCADAGVATARQMGLAITAVIGDFDSTDREALIAAGVPTILDSDPNRHDFEKSLDHITADIVLCFGFLGGRLDHGLASLSTLCKRDDLAAILIDEVSLTLACPDRLELTLPSGSDFAVYPMTEAKITTTGLRWDLTQLDLSPIGQISSSNRTKSESVTLERHRGQALVILDAAHWPRVVKALSRAGDGSD